jgi:phosphoribosylformylglycinamidine synthase
MSSPTPTALLIRTAGTNCDRELAHAFALAGAQPETVHLNELIQSPRLIEQAQLLAFPGGFSYGDDIAAGRIFAHRLRLRLLEPLLAAVARGTPVIGICNGFQVLAKLGLLPDPQLATQSVTLADNASGRFIDHWIALAPARDSVCIWTRGLPDAFPLPIAHGEGRFVTADAGVLDRLRRQGQIALRYAEPTRACGIEQPPEGYNPNGSIEDIAGICDPSGVVLGLMPHPERATDLTHLPSWTRCPAGEQGLSEPVGLRFFRNAVSFVRERALQAV